MRKIDRDSEGGEGVEQGFWQRAWALYRDGFRNMGKTGRQLCLLVVVKLLIMFGILRIFLFPNFLKQQADTPEGRSDYVGNELIERRADDPISRPLDETMGTPATLPSDSSAHDGTHPFPMENEKV